MYNTSFVHCMDPEWESSSNSLHCTATCSFQRQCKRGRRSCNSGSRDFIMTNSMSALIDIHAGMYDQRSAVCEKSGAMAIPTLQPSPCSGKAHFGKVAV